METCGILLVPWGILTLISELFAADQFGTKHTPNITAGKGTILAVCSVDSIGVNITAFTLIVPCIYLLFVCLLVLNLKLPQLELQLSPG